MGTLQTAGCRNSSQFLPDDLFHLNTSEVHVWQASLLLPDSLFAHLMDFLSAEERARAERFVFQDARARFIAAHGMLRAIVSRYVNEQPERLVVASGPHGKPSLAGLRGAAGKVRFNLAHSHDSALIAVARNREVGIDVEGIRDDVESLKLAERFFSPSEFQSLRHLSSDQANRMFFTLWTCKEAYLKARGIGLSLGLDQFEVRLGPEESIARVTQRGASHKSQEYLVRILSLGADYVGALAAEGEDWEVIYRQWP
ncbi:MAG TPA: 4'-phosphopantetheinyl transferase superfamily protein [Nitrospiraceae bacterium]|nr:4'-phosphopantetheinyl transferase superfamily protein [Nitrospiraceae bacterium]